MSSPREKELEVILRGLRDEVSKIEGYWTESIDNWMCAADGILARHRSAVATVEHARQPSTKRRVKQRAQARKLKMTLLAVSLALAATGNLARAQEVSIEDDVPEIGENLITRLPQAQLGRGGGGRGSESHSHSFFDRPNLALIGGELTVRMLDAQSTRANLTNPCNCYHESQLGPIANSNVRMYGYSLGVASAVIGASWLAHHHGWHKIERAMMMVDIAGDGMAAGRNYAIAGRLASIQPAGPIGPVKGVVEPR